MKRILTAALFLSLAVFVHFAAAAISMLDTSEGAEASGAGGDVHLTLQASDLALAAMVEKWETPVAQPLDALDTPQPPTPTTPAEPLLIQPEIDLAPTAKPLPLPVQPTEKAETFEAPKPPTTPPAPKPPAPPKKVEQPKAQPAPKTQQARAGSDHSSQATRAAGSGGGAQAGQARASQAAGLTKAARQSALRKWQSVIRSRIERRKRAPRGAGEGTVTLLITVANSGALQGVSVSRSSGISALDNAAVAAVRSARFPAAPAELRDPVFRFQLPMRFDY
jgi:protein TonB